MDKLVDAQGYLRYGLYDEPVENVNFQDYPLETPMGFKVPKGLKGFMANQFHFFGVLGQDIMVGMAVVDLKYLTNGFLYVYDRKTRKLAEARKISLPSSKVFIKTTPATPESVFSSRRLKIEILHDKVKASAGDVRVDVTMRPSASPLRLCSRAGYRGWVYTEKTVPIDLSGQVCYGGRTVEVGSPGYRGLMDWTAGYMRRHTFWNWAAAASTLPDGRSFGLNLSCGVNETSFTENAFWVDGVRTKVDTVNFVFQSRNLYEPWHVASYDQNVDLAFYPEAHREESVNALLVKSKFKQFMGTFVGRLRTDSGETIKIEACPGWAEDHYAKW